MSLNIYQLVRIGIRNSYKYRKIEIYKGGFKILNYNFLTFYSSIYIIFYGQEDLIYFIGLCGLGDSSFVVQQFTESKDDNRFTPIFFCL